MTNTDDFNSFLLLPKLNKS